jgi:serine/threonine protein kinase
MAGPKSEEKRAGPYRLDERVGSGGQGIVWRAFKGEGSEAVALKRLKLSHPKKRARFVQEVKIHAALSGVKAPNVMPLLDHNLEETASGGVEGYLVMPLARQSLENVAGTLRGRVELSLEVFCDIVNGVKAAHDGGIVHRDIKPGNILFMDSTLRNALVSDFGICLLRETPDEDRITEIGETVGAKYFMAPEQQHGGVSDVTPAADVYALGKLLHYMVTGRYLYRERLPEAFTEAELDSERRLQVIRDEILAKTIVEEPAGRIKTAGELLEVCRTVLDQFRNPGSNGVAPLNGTRATVLQRLYDRYAEDFTHTDTRRVGLTFDEIRQQVREYARPLLVRMESEPASSAEAVEELIRSQPSALAATLALSRVDSAGVFPQFKRLLEFTTDLSEGRGGYVAVSAVPQPLAGFLYMAASTLALHHQSWTLFKQLLTTKFKWVYQSANTFFSFGFDHPYFFHSDALGGDGAKHHDLYRLILSDDDIAGVTHLEKEQFVTAYVQAQFVMCLKAAKIAENSDQMVMMWADYGRFYGDRLIPLLEQIYHDPVYAQGFLRPFGESRDEFFAKLNDRLRYMAKNFFGGARYLFSSLHSWQPRGGGPAM